MSGMVVSAGAAGAESRRRPLPRWLATLGIPAPIRLAAGERLLWQGAPGWRALFRRLFCGRIVAGYFAVLMLADMAGARLQHLGRLAAVRAALPVLLTGAAVLAILAALAWGISRTTRYSITTRKVVLQFGLALPATLVLPLDRIAAASVRVRADHAGDIPLCLYPGAQLGFMKLWPHVRPWRLGRPEPMLRDIPNAAATITLLCRALETAQARRQAQQEALPPAA